MERHVGVRVTQKSVEMAWILVRVFWVLLGRGWRTPRGEDQRCFLGEGGMNGESKLLKRPLLEGRDTQEGLAAGGAVGAIDFPTAHQGFQQEQYKLMHGSNPVTPNYSSATELAKHSL